MAFQRSETARGFVKRSECISVTTLFAPYLRCMAQERGHPHLFLEPTLWVGEDLGAVFFLQCIGGQQRFTLMGRGIREIASAGGQSCQSQMTVASLRVEAGGIIQGSTRAAQPSQRVCDASQSAPLPTSAVFSASRKRPDAMLRVI